MSIKLIDYRSDIINQLDLANGIKESLIEYGFDLSLLLNTSSEEDCLSIGYRIGCCQNDTYCSNEILSVKKHNVFCYADDHILLEIVFTLSNHNTLSFDLGFSTNSTHIKNC
jgi:hypothetical protein